MNRLISLIPIHPFLFAAYSILFLWYHNIQEVTTRDIAWPLIYTVLIVSILYFILKLVVRGGAKRAAILASFSSLWFFSYALLYQLFCGLQLTGVYLGRHTYILPVWSIIMLLGWLCILSFKDSLIERLTNALNLVSGLLVAFSLAGIIFYSVKFVEEGKEVPSIPSPVVKKGDINPPGAGIAQKSMPLPDVYYIILDGYASRDTLKTAYHYDEPGFYDYLDEKGFYTASKSHSNYSDTITSIPSSLNMEYLQHLRIVAKSKGGSTANHRPKLGNSEVFKFFRSIGYKIAIVGSCAFKKEFGEEVDYKNKCNCDDEFKSIFLQSTPLMPLQDRLGFSAYRNSVLCTLSELAEVHKLPGRKFVYAHIMLPHPPFVFGPNGEPLSGGLNFKAYGNREGYVGQVGFVSSRIMQIVDTILQASAIRPIIVIQGDHGPMASFDFQDLLNKNPEALRIRYGILNTYYVPDDAKRFLYNSITPVNSFRVILTHCFNAHLGLLEDQSYVGQLPSEEFTDVTNIVNQNKPSVQHNP